jgi:hypothetical protein
VLLVAEFDADVVDGGHPVPRCFVGIALLLDLLHGVALEAGATTQNSNRYIWIAVLRQPIRGIGKKVVWACSHCC